MLKTFPSQPPQYTATLPFTILLLTLITVAPVTGYLPCPKNPTENITDYAFGTSKKYEGLSEFVKLRYHMGPVLTNIIIREHVNSISAKNTPHPSISGWWKTVTLYTDQTGSNNSNTAHLVQEKHDRFYSHGKSPTRLSKCAIIAKTKPLRPFKTPLPVNSRSGLYIFFTSVEVYLQDFRTPPRGNYYFTFPLPIVNALPYVCVGNRRKFSAGQCAYPYAVPRFMPKVKPLKATLELAE